MNKYRNFPTDVSMHNKSGVKESVRKKSMFKTDDSGHTNQVPVVLDGRKVDLPGDASIAAGLLGEGELISRISPASGKACAPHCLMGVCCECMMEIDGIRQRACMTRPARDMVINRHLDKGRENRQKEDPHGPSL